jgi:uncharacterized protein (TIGR00251 family)
MVHELEAALHLCLRPHPGGFSLQVLVQPRASRTRVVGVHGDRLKIQLAAPPVDGEANAALVDFLSDLLQLPRNHLQIATGQTSRRKTVRVLGLSTQKAERLIGQATLKTP